MPYLARRLFGATVGFTAMAVILLLPPDTVAWVNAGVTGAVIMLGSLWLVDRCCA